jgi:hypothetical protein
MASIVELHSNAVWLSAIISCGYQRRYHPRQETKEEATRKSHLCKARPLVGPAL